MTQFGRAVAVPAQNGVEKLASAQPRFGLDNASWFAVRCRPRCEKKIINELQAKGIVSFLPLHSAVHQWSDRRKLVHVPLFPGYVFVRLVSTPETRISVLQTIAVINFVGVRGIAIPIPDDQIEAVQTVLERGISFEPCPHLQIGQRVCIRGGSLDGIKGVLRAVNGDRSLVVSVELIQRSIAIRVTGYQVEAA